MGICRARPLAAHFLLDRTIASMPARIASGRRSHASITVARSGSFEIAALSLRVKEGAVFRKLLSDM